MFLCESTAGLCFQVALEVTCPRLVGKGDCRLDAPGTVRLGGRHVAFVVFLEAGVKVSRVAGVEAGWVGFALEDVGVEVCRVTHKVACPSPPAAASRPAES